ncbi:MAG: tail fiber domain-containing protein [Candidatus Aenigmarchaeota archaeon]|nr:tail fiber domain-containing protein [Candidatus Aenigmarchaeota archaeon]
MLLLEDSSGLCEAQPSTTGLTWSCSSDARLKANITSASPKLEYVLGIPLFDYTVIATGERATGPIAQETAGNYPELVRVGDDGYLIVSELPQPVIIKAIQELKAEKDALKKENRAMKSDIEMLKQEVKVLGNGGT